MLLYTVSGGNPSFLPKDIDGTDQWTSLTLNLPSQRGFVLLNIDEKQRYAGIVKDSWKLIVGKFSYRHLEFLVLVLQFRQLRFLSWTILFLPL